VTEWGGAGRTWNIGQSTEENLHALKDRRAEMLREILRHENIYKKAERRWTVMKEELK
jgi:hypothetical protein